MTGPFGAIFILLFCLFLFYGGRAEKTIGILILILAGLAAFLGRS